MIFGMNILSTFKARVALKVAGLLFFFMGVGTVQANPMMGQIPQIPAFLPMASAVPMTVKTPIDGEWVIDIIGKRIRIEAGRAYAVDPWLHAFVLKIQPGMVVVKDMRRVANGQYEANDLPLMGRWVARLNPSGMLNVNVAGVLGPVNFNLQPIRLDNPTAFEAEKMGGQGIGTPPPVQPLPGPPAYQPPPQYDTPPQTPPPAGACEEQLYDPRTGQTFCAD